MVYYYPETDGKVFLVEREGCFDFPRSSEELPFSVNPLQKMDIHGTEVIYCIPELPAHPDHWVNKEDVPYMENVDAKVREAVSSTFPRPVVEAIVEREERILLVKPDRGYNEGQWTLPGGFLVYGESPKEAVRREVEEEIGVELQIGGLLNLHSHIGDQNNYHWLLFFYGASIPGDAPQLSPQHEIEELKWFPREVSPEKISSPLMAHGLREIVEGRANP